ncbi:MAG: SRPBCC family protein [Acidimicrobiales bacterium]
MLSDDGEQITLVWEERGMPFNLIAAYGAGVQIHVEDLADHVTGHERRDPKPRFDALFPVYQALAQTIA